MKNEYPPKKCSLVHLISQLAWAVNNGIELDVLDVDESIVILHKESRWDYAFTIRNPEQRLIAEKIIMNWVNGIFPNLEEGEDLNKVEWP